MGQRSRKVKGGWNRSVARLAEERNNAPSADRTIPAFGCLICGLTGFFFLAGSDIIRPITEHFRQNSTPYSLSFVI